MVLTVLMVLLLVMSAGRAQPGFCWHLPPVCCRSSSVPLSPLNGCCCRHMRLVDCVELVWI